MKKAKRFLTGLLSAALALSLCAMPAMADETKVMTTPDWNKTGSITINKYEYNNTSADSPRDDGEGGTTIPDGAKKLNGVEFTIYKVQDDEWLKQYYQYTGTDSDSKPVKQPNVSDYVADGKIKADYKDKKVASKKTGEGQEAEGQVKFDKLELGLYVVIETDKPDSVTKATDPFLVSVPMTSIDKQNWLYDIIVNPKNKTEYAGITLQKKGKTGSQEDTTVMGGYEFKLEKYIEGSDGNPGTWTEITRATKNGVDNAGNLLSLTTSTKDGTIVISDLSAGVYRFTEKTTTGKDGYIVDGKTHYIFRVNGSNIEEITNEDEKAKYSETGYNNVFDAKDAGGNQVNIYNHRPDVDKEVIKRNGTPDKEADYNIGDRVPYVVTVKVPENITSLKKFVLEDKPTNLIDDVASVKVYNGDAEVSGFYTVAAKDGVGFTITFNPSKMADYAGVTLTIKYEAVLQPGAVATVEGNSNTIKLSYSNQILPTTTPGEEPNPSENTIEDHTFVYTFKIKIEKTAENKTTRLAGVKFDLYKSVKTADLTQQETNDSITNEVARKLGLPVSEDTTWVKITTLITSDSEDPTIKGTAEYKGLADGTYYLVETETVDGYNLLSAPVKVELSVSAKTEWVKKSTYDEKGNLVKHDVTKKNTTFENSQDATTGYTLTTIINRKGFDLPVTGGFGTLLFSGIGVLLVVAGVGVLLSLKKKNRT
jgi:fimbrial isopeptide formation D2 family protein/LPXTG-motif cell wall-anchored protein